MVDYETYVGALIVELRQRVQDSMRPAVRMHIAKHRAVGRKITRALKLKCFSLEEIHQRTFAEYKASIASIIIELRDYSETKRDIIRILRLFENDVWAGTMTTDWSKLLFAVAGLDMTQTRATLDIWLMITEGRSSVP